MTDFSDELGWLLKEKYAWSIEAVHAFQQVLSQDAQAALSSLSVPLRSDVEQLLAGVPVAYLIGWVPFLGQKIDLSLRPLIPRPETEYWIERCLTSQKIPPQKVLDLCSGSGCLSTAVLAAFPQVELVAVDIDPQAVAQTQLNLQRMAVPSSRVSVVQSDLFTQVTGQFDLIVCNPPYVDESGEWAVELKYEPAQAIFAPNRGFAVIEQIIRDVRPFLATPQSQLWLEFQHDQADQIAAACQQAQLNDQIHHDQFGRDRFAVINR